MRVDHGPCEVCGRPILYLGCRYCGPECNFSVLLPEGRLPPPPAMPSGVSFVVKDEVDEAIERAMDRLFL